VKWVENNCTKKGFGWGTNKWSKMHIQCIHTISRKENKIWPFFFFYYYQLATFPNQGCMYSNKNSNNFIVWLEFCFLNFPFYCWGFGLHFGTKIRTFHFFITHSKKLTTKCKKFPILQNHKIYRNWNIPFSYCKFKINWQKFGKIH